MKFQAFYLFYLLTILILGFGLLTKDTEVVSAGWNTTIITGYWWLLLPTAVAILFEGLIYHYWFYRGRYGPTRTIVLHFIFVLLAMLFSYNAYQMVIDMQNQPAPMGGARNWYILSLLLAGPLLILASIIVFVLGLIRAKGFSIKA